MAGLASAGSPMPKAPLGLQDQVAPKAKTVAEGQSLLARQGAKFMENKGQWDSRAKFLGRAPGLDFWVAKDGLVLSYYQSKTDSGATRTQGHAVGMRFVGAEKDFRFVGVDPKGAKTDYLGKNGEKAHRGVRSFGTVYADDVYRGIDFKLYYDQSSAPRYDFIVAPGADPRDIKLKFDGVDKVAVAKDGSISFETSLGKRDQSGLEAYQMVGDAKRKVEARFAVENGNQVRFQLGAYDKSKPLIIDPLVYGSYYGGADGADQVRAVSTDTQGGTYLAGATKSAFFPAIFGPFTWNVAGGWDAFVSKFQGDSYYHDYAAIIPGSFDDVAERIAVDSVGNVWVAGTSTSQDFPSNTKPGVFFLRARFLNNFTHPINGGQYYLNVPELAFDRVNQTILAWNASATEIQAALEGDYPPLAGKVTVTGGVPASNADGYRIQIAIDQVVSVTVSDEYETNFINTAIVSEGLQPKVIVEPLLPVFIEAGSDFDHAPNQRVRFVGSRFNPGLGSTFTLTFEGSETGDLSPNASAGAILQELDALGNTGDGEVATDGGSLYNAPVDVSFLPTTGDAPCNRMIVTQNDWPFPHRYVIDRPTDIWIMRFKQDSGSVLTPFEGSTVQVFRPYGEGVEDLSGFSIMPVEGATSASPVRITFAGTTDKPFDEPVSDTKPLFGESFPPGVAKAGYFCTISYLNGVFSDVPTLSKYIGARGTDNFANLRGLAVDAEGSIYVGGTLFAQGNSDTSQGASPVFDTTAGVWTEGRLHRYDDMYARKYRTDGSLAYSTLVGGNSYERAAGDLPVRRFVAESEVVEPGGSCIAVDGLGNLYITGTSGSFNYPRTRGVFGEVFSNNTVQVVVTKLNRDASELVYSTNLRTSGGVISAGGIAVDSRGQAYITGFVSGIAKFPNPANGETPGDPLQPNGAHSYFGSIPTTADALRATYATRTNPEMHTFDGWILVLNPQATDLVYGSYIGSDLDDITFAPYVDQFGDVWVMGWTDMYREYVRVSSDGTPTIYRFATQLAEGFLTPLAFKRDPEWQTALPTNFETVEDSLYGIYNYDGPSWLPFYTPMSYRRDGYVLKFRLGLPVISSLTLSQGTLAGGDPTGGSNHPSTVGAVVLSAAAPAGGVTINLSLDKSEVASFSQSNSENASTITIPQGQTTGTFNVYSRSVLGNSDVDIKADFEGNFKIVRLRVVPWLQQLSLSPNSVVGGAGAVGRVKIFQVAPAGGVTVGLSSANATVVQAPSTLTIPAGQDTATFNLTTGGVSKTTEVQVNASLLGVGLSQSMKVQPANLVSVTFAPDRVAAESTTTGTVTLNGVAGEPFTVSLVLEGAPAGYTVTPSTLTFAQGDRTKTFRVTTGPEGKAVTRKVTATRAAQGNYTASTASGTFFVDAVSVTGLTLNPIAVAGGGNVIGTVTIGTPAPTGGVAVKLSTTNSAYAPVPARITVPAGSTTTTFVIRTVATPDPISLVIKAFRGTFGTPSYSQKAASFRILPLKLTLALSPAEVVGGLANSQGTLTLSGNAPAGGLKVALSSSNTAAATVPASVTIPAGTRTARFTATSKTVNADTTSVIRGLIGLSNQASSTLSVRTFGVSSVSFLPSTVQGGGSTTFTVTLQAAAPAGGSLIQIDEGANAQIVNLPTSITIPAGKKTASIKVTTNPVSRQLKTQVTVLYRNKTASTVLTVNPKTP